MRHVMRIVMLPFLGMLVALPLHAQDVAKPEGTVQGMNYHRALSIYLDQGANLAGRLQHLLAENQVNEQLATEYDRAMEVHVKLAENNVADINSVLTTAEKSQAQQYLTEIDRRLNDLSDSLTVLQQQLQASSMDKPRLVQLAGNLRAEFNAAENIDHKQIQIVRGIYKNKETEEVEPVAEQTEISPVNGVDYHHALSAHLNDGAAIADALHDMVGSDDYSSRVASDYYQALKVHTELAQSDLRHIDTLLTPADREKVSPYMTTIKDQLQDITDSLAVLKQDLSASPLPKQRLETLAADMQTEFAASQGQNHMQIMKIRGIMTKMGEGGPRTE